LQAKTDIFATFTALLCSMYTGYIRTTQITVHSKTPMLMLVWQILT